MHNLQKYGFILTLLLILVLLPISHSLSQPSDVLNIISADAYYLRTERVKSPARHKPGSKYIKPALTTTRKDYYNLRITIHLKRYSEGPLDIRLISDRGYTKIIRIEEDLSLLRPDDIYYYSREIVLNEIGWYEFEIGYFPRAVNGNEVDIIYDKTRIYVNKFR